MRPVIFTAAARAELIAAQDWYEGESPGLGRRFRGEIDRLAARMADNPRQFPVIFKRLRRARVNTFPYALFFSEAEDAFVVIACFHSSRDPQHWRRRV